MRDPQVPSALDCMHCGFCQQVCPTYLATGDENESPRGRLFLMRAVQEDRLALDDAVAAHLDHCLDCRACETACPSGVEYGRVLEPFRIAQRTARPQDRPPSQRGLAGYLQREVVPDRRRLRRWLLPARLAQGIGLRQLAGSLGLGRLLPPGLRRLSEQLPTLPPRTAELPERLPAEGPTRARVGLFLGCAGEVFTPQVNRAAVRVLQKLSCEVWIPPSQGCCGALAYHEGRAARAAEDWRRLAAIFGTEHAPEVLLTTAAGCGSMLHDLPRVAEECRADDAGVLRLGARARDLHVYLAQLPWPESLHPVPLRAAYDPACHLLHAQGVRAEPLELLARVPGLSLVAHEEAELCCGAAGSYVLHQPELADQIGTRKASFLLASGAEAVITANVGCALQIQRQTRALGRELSVYHPAEILAAALDPSWPLRGRRQDLRTQALSV